MGICGKELGYCLILCLGSFMFGYILAYPSVACPVMEEEYKLTEFESGLFNAISSCTAMIGPFLTQLLLRFMGRRLAVHVISDCGVVFWLIHLATNGQRFWLGIVSRGLIGLVLGAYSAIIPMYIIELAPSESSGFFGSLNNLGIAFGIAILYILGQDIKYWILIIIGAGICLLLAALVWLVPESPASLEKISLSNDKLCVKSNAKSLILGIMLMVFQQFSGINAILTNLVSLLSKAGINIGSGYASALASSAQIITIFTSGLIVDKIGRRIAWGISASGVTIFLILYSLSLKFGWGAWASLAFIFLFLLFYGVGVGPIPWYIVPELFPSTVRSLATNIAAAANWATAFVVILGFNPMQTALGEVYTPIIFAGISLIGCIFGIVLLKEPGRALDSGFQMYTP